MEVSIRQTVHFLHQPSFTYGAGWPTKRVLECQTHTTDSAFSKGHRYVHETADENLGKRVWPCRSSFVYRASLRRPILPRQGDWPRHDAKNALDRRQ